MSDFKKLSFLDYHTILLMEIISRNYSSYLYSTKEYFSKNRALGSKDRRQISDWIHTWIKWFSYFNYKATEDYNDSFENILNYVKNFSIEEALNDEKAPLHTKYGFSKELFNLIFKDHGKDLACEIATISNERAPLTIRVNILKTPFDSFFNHLKNHFEITKTKRSNVGISFKKQESLTNLHDYKQGFFEIQDEGSQLLANYADVQPGMKVLDLCAGAGGKSLAIAHKLNKDGELFLYDTRPDMLEIAKKRLLKSGFNRFTILSKRDIDNIHEYMDLVIIDAPCSGTGTLRRNPQNKITFSLNMLEDLCYTQRELIELSASLITRQGKICYMTCSVLNKENEDVINEAVECLPLIISKPFFKCLPTKDECDGFFAAELQHK